MQVTIRGKVFEYDAAEVTQATLAAHARLAAADKAVLARLVQPLAHQRQLGEKGLVELLGKLGLWLLALEQRPAPQPTGRYRVRQAVLPETAAVGGGYTAGRASMGLRLPRDGG